MSTPSRLWWIAAARGILSLVCGLIALTLPLEAVKAALVFLASFYFWTVAALSLLQCGRPIINA